MQVTEPTKLRARDVEDMRIVAACLQDALVAVSDIAYQKRQKRFVLVANRFMWEATSQAGRPASHPAADPAAGARDDSDASFEDQAGPRYQRIHAGLCFDRVKRVSYQGLDPRARGQILNLLTLEAEPRRITLVFSGGILIRLEVGAIACHLEDLGETWPTRWQPSHDASPPPPGG